VHSYVCIVLKVLSGIYRFRRIPVVLFIGHHNDAAHTTEHQQYRCAARHFFNGFKLLIRMANKELMIAGEAAG
jgi:hypothetical protein